MISICIPTYNFDIKPLIDALKKEILRENLTAEIVVIDDGSDEKFKHLNRETCVGLNYQELETNVGRAKIRNLFLNFAKGDHFLFLDCDSLIHDSNFISNYLNAISETTSVICGGRIYPSETPKKNYRLNWKYGIVAESRSAQIRSRAPFDSFMTNNFLVKKVVFEKIKFNENIRNYGHEDTLFGFELLSQKEHILHIENPVLNGHIEENQEFLHKTSVGIANLVFILHLLNQDAAFIQSNKLLRFYFSIERKRLIWLFRIAFPFSKALFLFLMQRGFVSIFLFSVNKMSVFDQYWKQKRS